MDCPQCGGATFDNREKVSGGWKGPLFKCKDQEGCGWKKWPPKGQQQGGKVNGNGGGPKRPLAPLYHDCLTLAGRIVRKALPEASTADVLAGAATLFIAASNSGAPLMPMKPKPAPEPEPEPQYDDEEIPF